MRWTLRSAGPLLAAGLLGVAAAAPGIELTELEQKGKRVYAEGVGSGGAPIMARIGVASTPIPATVMPCANCHGADGRGRPEGGVLPPDITWSHLTKPYGHEHPFGRTHPPFTEESLAEAITAGVDPAGNRLDPAMPRYAISGTDLDALVAYLKRVELDRDPGLSHDVIRIGTFLPLEGRLASLGGAMRAILEAYFDQVNGEGGVYGRRLELVTADASGPPEQQVAALRGLISNDIFALVSPFVAGIEQDAAGLSEAHGVPSIGPFTQFPESGHVVHRTTFYLFAGLPEQARALVKYAVEKLPLERPRLALVAEPGEAYAAVEQAAADEARRKSLELITPMHYGPTRYDAAEMARKLHADGVEAVLLAGSQDDFRRFLAAARDLGWVPYLLIPGSMAGRELMAADPRLDGRIFLAYPSLPGSGNTTALAQFSELRERNGIAPAHTPAQISAVVAAKVLVEGLKRTGKDLSREALVTRIEQLTDYDSGLAAPISYHGNRRIGALGAHIVGVDLKSKKFTPAAGGWMPLEDNR